MRTARTLHLAILVCALLLGSSVSQCLALPTLSDSLNGGSGGGIIGTEDWNSAETVFQWDVTDNGDGTWHYEYTYTVERKSLSHLIIEVSDTFTLDDYEGSGNPILDTYGIGTHGNSNPDIPGDIYGLKFEDFEDFEEGGSWVVAFDSPRVPVWGNFYAKDGTTGGNEVFAYNTGFGDGDAYIAVPDTFERIPAPGAILLGAIGTAFVARLRRRRAI